MELDGLRSYGNYNIFRQSIDLLIRIHPLHPIVTLCFRSGHKMHQITHCLPDLVFRSLCFLGLNHNLYFYQNYTMLDAERLELLSALDQPNPIEHSLRIVTLLH